MAYGTVVRYNQRDGHGLIKDRGGKYIRVEGRHVDRALRTGDIVEFEMRFTNGRSEAVDVTRLF